MLKIAAAAAVAGMFPAAAAVAAEDGTITVGVSAPKTGPLAGGATVTHFPAIELWAHDVNEAGGIDVGGTKMKVKLIEYDDQTNGEVAIKNIQRLATVDKVDFIAPPYSTGLNLATAPIIAQYGYPQLAATAVSDGLEGFASRWGNSFWLLGTSEDFAKGVVDTLVKLRDKGVIGDKVALVNVADAFGLELISAAKPALADAGFKIVYETSYPLDQTEFAPIISAAQEAKPDAFVAFSYPQDTFGLTAQAKIANLDVGAFYVGVGTAFPAFLQANGAAAEGILGAGAVNPEAKGMPEWRKRHKEVTGVEADYWASAMTYAAMEILAQGITKAGSLDKAAVVDAIKDGTFDTVLGEIHLDGNINHKFWTVGQWQGDKYYGVASTGFGDEAEPIAKKGWGE